VSPGSDACLCVFLQSAQHVRAHWFWRHVAYKNGVIPDEDKPDRSDNEKAKDGKPASNEIANGNGQHADSNKGVHDPTVNDDVSRRNVA